MKDILKYLITHHGLNNKMSVNFGRHQMILHVHELKYRLFCVVKIYLSGSLGLVQVT